MTQTMSGNCLLRHTASGVFADRGFLAGGVARGRVGSVLEPLIRL